MTAGLPLVAACVGLETVRELCLKRAAAPLAAAAGARDWWALLRPSPAWAAIAIWGAETLLWVRALQFLPLTLAFPLAAASYATVPLAGRLLLGERLRPAQAAGVLLVAAGVACVGLGGQ